jgi:hypothetical protein
MANNKLSAFLSLLLVFCSGIVVGGVGLHVYTSKVAPPPRPQEKRSPEEFQLLLSSGFTRKRGPLSTRRAPRRTPSFTPRGRPSTSSRSRRSRPYSGPTKSRYMTLFASATRKPARNLRNSVAKATSRKTEVGHALACPGERSSPGCLCQSHSSAPVAPAPEPLADGEVSVARRCQEAFRRRHTSQPVGSYQVGL